MNLVALLASLVTVMRGYYTTVHGKITSVMNVLNNHIGNTQNPHRTTKAHVGLGRVPNYPAATKPKAVVGTDNNSLMTPRRTAEAIDAQVFEQLADAFESATERLG